MKKLIAFIIILIVGATMYFTTPDKKAHKEAMMTAIREYVDEEADNRLGDNVLSDLSKVFANNSIKALLGAKLKLHDYVFLNTTTMRIDGKEKLLSVGLLGHVFTFDKEMLQKNLNHADGKEDDTN